MVAMKRRGLILAAIAACLSTAVAAPADAQAVRVALGNCQDHLAPRTNEAALTTGPTWDSEALRLMRQIAGHAGLAPNFVIGAGEAKGGALAATCHDAMSGQIRRIIVYRPTFIEAIRRRTQDYWGLVGLLAHEIGHHANGHHFSGGWGREKELEADRFSGFAMARMGASLEQALSGVRIWADDTASSTHPARDQRERAVTAGWNAGRNGPARADTSAEPRRNPRIIKVPPETAAR